jgi:hypothetical protein
MLCSDTITGFHDHKTFWKMDAYSCSCMTMHLVLQGSMIARARAIVSGKSTLTVAYGNYVIEVSIINDVLIVVRAGIELFFASANR